MAGNDPGQTPRQRPRCPICGAPQLAAFRPFCSARCADVDLNRWLSGVYAIPAVEEDEPSGAGPGDPARVKPN
ncbi:MAG: DNA gyrase inhibitor YacG [Methylobacteriaceae bacterium]|nr:DNA gyrase inhibitor YacG [Methylobacteriaceae bacterium]